MKKLNSIENFNSQDTILSATQLCHLIGGAVGGSSGVDLTSSGSYEWALTDTVGNSSPEFDSKQWDTCFD